MNRLAPFKTKGFSFVPNPSAIEQIERNPLMRVAMHARAENAAEVAREIAPVDEGDYRDGIEAASGIVDGRAQGRVVGRNFKSHWIEFGTIFMAAHAVLRRAVDSLGLDTRDSS